MLVVVLLEALNWLGFLNITVDDGDQVFPLLQPDSGTVETILRTNVPVPPETVSVHPDGSFLILLEVKEGVIGLVQLKFTLEYSEVAVLMTFVPSNIGQIDLVKWETGDIPRSQSLIVEVDPTVETFLVVIGVTDVFVVHAFYKNFQHIFVFVRSWQLNRHLLVVDHLVYHPDAFVVVVHSCKVAVLVQVQSASVLTVRDNCFVNCEPLVLLVELEPHWWSVVVLEPLQVPEAGSLFHVNWRNVH